MSDCGMPSIVRDRPGGLLAASGWAPRFPACRSRSARRSFAVRAARATRNGYEYAASTTLAADCSAASTSPSVRSTLRRLPGRQLLGARGETGAALLRRRALVPGHLQLLPRRPRLPPGIGDDGDAAVEAGQFLRAFDDEGVPDAGHGLDLVEIRADGLAREHRALLVHRPQHVRHGEVDAVDRLARDDGLDVVATALACR